jgi:predicted metal-binding protein
MPRRIGIIYCKRINDASCVGCAKCYKAANELTHAFEGIEEGVQIVFMTSCGDCPGLVLPKVDLQLTCLKALDVEVDEVYFGTCVKKATAVMNCPMNVEGITGKLREMFGLEAHMGTHDY